MSNTVKQEDRSTATGATLGDLEAISMHFTEGIARYQGEWFSLLNRRVSAYLEIPERLSHCKTPVDLWREQVSFLATMQRHYFEAAQHLIAVVVQEHTAIESEEGGTRTTPERLPRSATPELKDKTRPDNIQPRAA